MQKLLTTTNTPQKTALQTPTTRFFQKQTTNKTPNKLLTNPSQLLTTTNTNPMFP